MIPLFFSRSSNNARGIEVEVLIYATQFEKGFYFSKNKKTLRNLSSNKLKQ